MRISTCATVQPDHRLCNSNPEKITPCFRDFNFIASLCKYSGWIGLHIVANSSDGFPFVVSNYSKGVNSFHGLQYTTARIIVIVEIAFKMQVIHLHVRSCTVFSTPIPKRQSPLVTNNALTCNVTH